MNRPILIEFDDGNHLRSILDELKIFRRSADVTESTQAHSIQSEESRTVENLIELHTTSMPQQVTFWISGPDQLRYIQELQRDMVDLEDPLGGEHVEVELGMRPGFGEDFDQNMNLNPPEKVATERNKQVFLETPIRRQDEMPMQAAQRSESVPTNGREQMENRFIVGN